MEEPELGSAAPPTIQASRWLPMMIVSSGFVPLIVPITSQVGVIFSSMKFVRETVIPGAGPVLYVASKPPFHPSRLINSPDVPWPSRAFRNGKASRWDMGKDGILGRFGGLLTCLTPGFDGYPGVVGSPGYWLMYATDPRCMEDGWRAGPSTRSQTYVSAIRHVRSSHTRICDLSFGLLWSVVTGITEHDHSDHAMCLGIENLNTTERTSVLRESDLSFQIDIQCCECGEVVFVATAVVH